jgi:hypothetical protein
MGAAALPVRFTKRIRGRLAGLVFIRDVTTPATLATRVQIRQDEDVLQTVDTDEETRYYAAAPEKAGTYDVQRIDPDDADGTGRTGFDLVNREVKAAHLRAVVWDRADGRPLDQALVAAALVEEDAPFAREALSNAAGFYALGACYAGAFFVRARAEDYTTNYADGLEAVQQVILDVDFPLEFAGAISGTVTDGATSDPLGGVVIYAVQAEAPSLGWGSAVSDADGSFTIWDLDAMGEASGEYGVYDLFSKVRGYVTRHASGVEVPIPAVKHTVTEEQDITLDAAAVLSGTLVDSSQNPIADATVVAREAGDGSLGFGLDATDTAGVYEIDDLEAPGEYATLVAEVSYYPDAEECEVDPSTTTTADFDMEPLEGITGTVTDADTSDPIAGAEISIENQSGNMGGLRFGVTDDDGNFLVECLDVPGDYTGRISAAGYNTLVISDLSVTAGQNTTADAELTLAGSISGLVTDEATDLPLEGAVITAWRDDAPAPLDGATVSDGDGVYLLGSLHAPGTYHVRAEADGYEPMTLDDIDVESGEDTPGVDFELSAS